MKKRDLICVCIVCFFVIGAVIISLLDENNDNFFFAAQVFIVIGMIFAGMILYFRKDTTLKMICKSIAFIISLAVLIVICKERLANLNVVLVLIIFNLIGAMINIVDKAIIKIKNKRHR